MPDTSRIYIPKRVSGMLRGIYTSRVTVVIAPDGCGKSTLVREFTSRTRPAGISLRTITGAGNRRVLRADMRHSHWAGVRNRFLSASSWRFRRSSRRRVRRNRF
ncbi:MAG: hypothetical protein ACLSG5_04240 [Oscillospiraceae bacterium]